MKFLTENKEFQKAASRLLTINIQSMLPSKATECCVDIAKLANDTLHAAYSPCFDSHVTDARIDIANAFDEGLGLNGQRRMVGDFYTNLREKVIMSICR